MLNPFNAIAGTVRFERAPEEMASLALDYDVAQFEAGDLALHVEYHVRKVELEEQLQIELQKNIPRKIAFLNIPSQT